MARKIKKVDKRSWQGRKRNCHHNWSDNLAINVKIDQETDYRICLKNCGAWKKKVIYYFPEVSLFDLLKQRIEANL